MENFATFNMEQIPGADIYKLLASLIMPRPIAWVVTESTDGVRNAAPYSFFNVLSADPPLLAISFSAASDRDSKDSYANIMATGELVVNLVPEELAEAMNQTAIDAPRGVDETALAGLELQPSLRVRPPRIAGSPAAFECRVQQWVDTGGSSRILIARIMVAHVRESAFTDRDRLHLDPAQLRLIGRMHGAGGYCTTRDIFTLERRKWSERNELSTGGR